MDANVLRSLNDGPMGPQGPVKKNYAIMNQEAGFAPVVRIYSHKFEDVESDTGIATLTGGGADPVVGPVPGPAIPIGGDPIIDDSKDNE